MRKATVNQLVTTAQHAVNCLGITLGEIDYGHLSRNANTSTAYYTIDVLRANANQAIGAVVRLLNELAQAAAQAGPSSDLEEVEDADVIEFVSKERERDDRDDAAPAVEPVVIYDAHGFDHGGEG
jgi:hypothetical protein